MHTAKRTYNIGELGEYWMKNPMPITRQAIINVQTYAEWVRTGVQQTIPNLQRWVDNTVVPAFKLAGTLFQAGQVERPWL
ncbi:hypothetical protein [Mycobacterium sp. DL99]|uniref:hypothetical protein n=1 Tax=Mycobacterium sp. DL99 TaxID=2528957 RepID=UPI001081943B|nr:hypothetical protein [Mycobacterium sp. DL99]